jgi:YD repeat-containing protein
VVVFFAPGWLFNRSCQCLSAGFQFLRRQCLKQGYYVSLLAHRKRNRIPHLCASSVQLEIHRLLQRFSVTDKRGNTMVVNQYDGNGRVSKQTLADGATWGFAYTLSAAGKVVSTSVTNPRGYVEEMTFNASGYVVQVIRALGQPEQQLFSYVREPETNLRVTATDPLSRVTKFTYDYAGRTTSITRLFGTRNAVTYKYEYDPVFGNLISYSDPLNRKRVVPAACSARAKS